MAITSVVIITTNLTGDLTASATAQRTNASAPGQIQTLTLAVGFNSITIPAGANGVTIKPPVGNTQTITIKGVTGDTGVLMAPGEPFSITLGSGAVLGITIGAGSSVAVLFTWD